MHVNLNNILKLQPGHEYYTPFSKKEEETLSFLEKNREALRFVFDRFPQNLCPSCSTFLKNLFSKISFDGIKTSFPSRIIARISTIQKMLQDLQTLEKSDENFAEKINQIITTFQTSKVPNKQQLLSEIQRAVTAYADDSMRYRAIDQTLGFAETTVKENLSRHSISLKHSKLDWLNALLSETFQNLKGATEEQKQAIRLLHLQKLHYLIDNLANKLEARDRKGSFELLDKEFAAWLKSIHVRIQSKSDLKEGLRILHNFINAVQKLHFSQENYPKLFEGLGPIFQTFSSNFLSNFEELKTHALGSLKQSNSETTAVSNLLQKGFYLLRNWKNYELIYNENKEKLLNMIMQFDQKYLEASSKSTIFAPIVRDLFHSILELTEINDQPSITFDKFSSCMKNVVSHLCQHTETLTAPESHSILIETLVEIVRRFTLSTSVRAQEFLEKPIIDLSSQATSHSFTGLQVTFDKLRTLIGAEICVQMKMKIEQDRIIALISAHLNPEDHPVETIANWIEEHPEYDLAGFSIWMQTRIQKRAPLLRNVKDSESLYALYQRESPQPPPSSL